MRTLLEGLTEEKHAELIQWCLDNEVSYESWDHDKTKLAIHLTSAEQAEALELIR